MDKEYVKRLEKVIQQVLKPLKNIPFNVVIQTISGNRVIPFNRKNSKDRALLQKLRKAARLAGLHINREPIFRARANEVGNDIEPYIREALQKVGYPAQVPKTRGGSKKGAGYPDIEFKDEFQRTNYLECKTYNIENISTTQRSFYFSPSEKFKVTRDGHHFILSYEMYVDGRKNRKNIYRCRHWKILSIEKLLVDLKHEFNCDNRRLYADGFLLAEGDLKGRKPAKRKK